MRSFFISCLYPVQLVTVSVFKGVTSIPRAINDLRNLSGENHKLKKEISFLVPKLITLTELKKENTRLRQALSFAENNSFANKLLTAQIVSRAPTPWFCLLSINQGSQNGVKNNMTVISRDGLVGKIIEVSKYSSKIMLLTDGESSVAALDARSRDFGVVAGSGSNKLFMKYVDTQGDIKEADQVVTSNVSLIFPPGIPIGQVVVATKGEHDLFYHIEIKPAVDFSRLEEVFIVL
ncbi:MAG: rod shape-determining protein MreC [Candidatus Saganbacteria bacterium]|nr:rod shape-determining protein MreC [Candidatus Saganbacteria bacterium]